MSLIRTVSAAELGHDHITIRAPVVGVRIVREQLMAYLQLADGSEAEPIDLVPLLAWMERVRREG